MKLKIFGKLTDFITDSEYDFPSENLATVQDLKTQLAEKFPVMAEITYIVVVNGVKAEDADTISEDDEVALLPPYSGG